MFSSAHLLLIGCEALFVFVIAVCLTDQVQTVLMRWSRMLPQTFLSVYFNWLLFRIKAPVGSMQLYWQGCQQVPFALPPLSLYA